MSLGEVFRAQGMVICPVERSIKKKILLSAFIEPYRHPSGALGWDLGAIVQERHGCAETNPADIHKLAKALEHLM